MEKSSRKRRTDGWSETLDYIFETLPKKLVMLNLLVQKSLIVRPAPEKM